MNAQATMKDFGLQNGTYTPAGAHATIEAAGLDQVASQFIQRMLAPGECTDGASRLPGWLVKDASLGLLAGLLLGAVAFGMLGHKPPKASSPELSAAVEPPSSKPVAPAPAAAIGEDSARSAPASDPAPEEKRLAVLQDDRFSRRFTALRSSTGRNSFRALLRKGWQNFRRRRYQPASVAFGRAVHANPRQTDGYYGLALSLFEQGNDGVALRVLESAERKTGPKAEIWVLAGSIYQWLGRERAARMMYRRYLERSPRGPFAGDVKALLARKHLPKLFD